MPGSSSRDLPQAELETLLELGEGGMATAYLARALGAGGFQRLVVIKRLHLRQLGVPDAVERFMAEARVAARIHHANVVGTQQVGRDAAGPFIVLDYIEGGSLDDLIIEGPLPIPVVLRIALDVLAGLQAVHEAKDVDGRPLAILHRDISLQNILVSALDGVARLSDFGVAKSALGKVHTEDGVLVGKLVYFPPEYLRREPVGPPADLYALGVTLWLVLARQEPWDGASDAQIIREILDNGIPPLERYLELAPPISELVMRACERDPRRRFQSAREMADVLQRFERERGWLASHAEVAALVSDVLGPELQLRRNAVSRLTCPMEFAATSKRPIASLPKLSEPPSGTHRVAAAPRVNDGHCVDVTQRLNATPGPAALPETRRLTPAERPPDVPTPARASRPVPSRIVMLGVLVAVAGATAIAVVGVISYGRVEERAGGTAPDAAIVSAREPKQEPALEPSAAQIQSSKPTENGGKQVPLEPDAGLFVAPVPSARSLAAEDMPRRRRNEPPRDTSTEQGSLRKQNPYRRGSTE